MRRTKNSKKTEVCGSKNKVVTNLRGLGLNQYTVPGSITLQSTTDGLDVKDWKNQGAYTERPDLQKKR